MTPTSEDVIATAQDQFLAALQSAQSAVLEGVRLWSGAVDGVVATDLLNSVPGLDKVPSPATYAALRMDFAEKLLAHQREFIEQLLTKTETAATQSAMTTPCGGSVPSTTKATAS